MILADTSGLLALFNDREPRHRDVRDSLAATRDVLLVSPFVVADLDHLLGSRIGVAAQLAVLRTLTGLPYELATVDADLLSAAADVVEQYADLGLGVTDASIVVLADRHRSDRVLTLDHRHFRTVRSLSGGPFELLP